MALFGKPSARDEAREAAYRQWFQRQNPLAMVSLVLSVFSMTHLGTLLVDGFAGVSLGAAALVMIDRGRRSGSTLWYHKTEGQLLAIGGILIGAASLILAAYIYTRPG